MWLYDLQTWCRNITEKVKANIKSGICQGRRWNIALPVTSASVAAQNAPKRTVSKVKIHLVAKSSSSMASITNTTLLITSNLTKKIEGHML